MKAKIALSILLNISVSVLCVNGSPFKDDKAQSGPFVLVLSNDVPDDQNMTTSAAPEPIGPMQGSVSNSSAVNATDIFGTHNNTGKHLNVSEGFDNSGVGSGIIIEGTGHIGSGGSYSLSEGSAEFTPEVHHHSKLTIIIVNQVFMEDLHYRGLPTEILGFILDILALESSWSALRSCSLASRLFCTLAQSHLFRDITLYETYIRSRTVPSYVRNNFSPAGAFLRQLENSPHIASYIHGLTVQCNWVYMASAIPPSHWLDTDTSMSRLLPQLVNLRRLSIKGNKPLLPSFPTFRPRAWRSFAQSFRDAVAESINTQSLHELDLTGVGSFPVHFLRHGKEIKRLHVAHLFVDQNTFDTSDVHTKLHQLEMFHIDEVGTADCSTTISSPSWPYDLTSLDTFIIYPSDFHDSIGLLSISMKNLTHLHIQTGELQVVSSFNSLGFLLKTYQTNPPSLQNFSNLRSLTIDAQFTVRTFHHRSLVDYFTTPVRWIRDLLESMITSHSPSTGTLQEINLNLSFPQPFPHELIRLVDISLGFIVVHLLPNNFPAVRSFKLHIIHLDHSGYQALKKEAAQWQGTQSGVPIFWEISE
ncbi:hypothetical protein CVT26_009879 [Gymnopilus dilepis]|uniref:F-box domain-containing protein n=1 Tax=Gymnopilus dilepis TaxID=231916 RepID=A0A409YC02_9AGAR|nr:hypothetical protein CVT26_009879 [Gymnopilus dilepis]